MLFYFKNIQEIREHVLKSKYEALVERNLYNLRLDF